MSTQPNSLLTPEEYLALDNEAEFKSEYYAGEIYAMSGALRPHNVISLNVASGLHEQLRGRECEAYGSDMRVRSGDGLLYAYPDVSVACNPSFAEGNERTLLNPVLIVEVLSASTEAFDRGLKFESYQTIGWLQEYLMVASTRVHADLYCRQADGRWLLSSVRDVDETIELASCGCRLKVGNVYEKVKFPAA